MTIFLYQLTIIGTLLLTRAIAPKRLMMACLIWTAFTIINLFWPPLIVIQLLVIWVTFVLISPSNSAAPRVVSTPSEPAIVTPAKQKFAAKQLPSDSSTPSSLTVDTKAHSQAQNPARGGLLDTKNTMLGELNGYVSRAAAVQKAMLSIHSRCKTERMFMEKALERAESSIESESRFLKDPELRELFEKNLAAIKLALDENQQYAPPERIRRVNLVSHTSHPDLQIDETIRRRFEADVDDYAKFLESVLVRLSSPELIAAFEKKMRDFGCEDLLVRIASFCWGDTGWRHSGNTSFPFLPVSDFNMAVLRIWPTVQGDADGQNKLGWMYRSGRGVPKDDVHAASWFRKAAEQGHAKAQCNLGQMYFYGEGVQQDDAQAVSWCRKAAEQGLAKAQNKLGWMYASGRGVPKDDVHAASWFRKAAEQGHAKAQFNLGKHYYNGEGIPQDHAQALNWYRKAAEQGLAPAEDVIAHMARSEIVLIHPSRSAIFPPYDLRVAANLDSDLVTKEEVFDRPAKYKSQHEIKAIAADLKIPLLAHFTRVSNLASILEHGLLSTEEARALSVVPHANDLQRLDRHPDAISLSIAFPNYKMFYQCRQKYPREDWVVLIIDPAVLWTKRCGFYQRNAADHRVRDFTLARVIRASAFRSMFDPVEGVPTRQEQRLKDFEPTDPQAEILVFDAIGPESIEGIAFESHAVHDACAHLMGDRKWKVYSPGAGLFGSRGYSASWGN